MAADMTPDVLIRRDTLRDLLRYVRRLERDVAETGEFWWFAFCNGCPSVFQTLRQPGTNSSRGNWQQAANGTCVGVAFAAVVHPHPARARRPSVLPDSDCRWRWTCCALDLRISLLNCR